MKIKSFKQFLNEFEIEGEHHKNDYIDIVKHIMKSMILDWYNLSDDDFDYLKKWVDANAGSWYNDFMKWCDVPIKNKSDFNMYFHDWINHQDTDDLIGDF